MKTLATRMDQILFGICSQQRMSDSTLNDRSNVITKSQRPINDTKTSKMHANEVKTRKWFAEYRNEITVHGLVAVHSLPFYTLPSDVISLRLSQLKTGTGAPLIATGAGRNNINNSLRLLLSLPRLHADKMRLQAWDVTTRQSTTQIDLASPMTEHSHMQYLRFLTKPNCKAHSSARWSCHGVPSPIKKQ